MWKLARKATTFGILPHRLLHLHTATNENPTRWYQGDNRQFSDGNLSDFDDAVLDFWDWAKALQDAEEPVKVKSLPNPGKNYSWSSRRKYRTMGAIFSLYGGQADDGMDPAVAEIDLDELMDWLNEPDTEADEWH